MTLATTGTPSSGLASLTINGGTPPAAHTVNATTATLSFAALPPASASAQASVGSSVSTASTRVDVMLHFKAAAQQQQHQQHQHQHQQHQQRDEQTRRTARHAARITPPLGLIHHFSAATLATTLNDTAPVTSWPNTVKGGPPVSFPCKSISGSANATAPVFTSTGKGGVVFNGKDSLLCSTDAASALPAQKTFIAAFKSGAQPAQVPSLCPRYSLFLATFPFICGSFSYEAAIPYKYRKIL